MRFIYQDELKKQKFRVRKGSVNIERIRIDVKKDTFRIASTIRFLFIPTYL